MSEHLSRSWLSSFMSQETNGYAQLKVLRVIRECSHGPYHLKGIVLRMMLFELAKFSMPLKAFSPLNLEKAQFVYGSMP